jgi:nickel/cobalt transporter (NicO) family protein
MALVVAGLASGALHAVSGPDHVAGLAPLALLRQRAAWRIGLVWGAGHAVGSALAGGLLAMLLASAQLEAAEVWGERVAGLALVGLGVVGLVRRASEHAAVPGSRGRAVVLVGVVHGATGAAGLLLLAPAALAGSTGQALAYLGGFAVGSTIAMSALTALLATAGRAAGAARVTGGLARAASGLSVAIGAFWLVAAGA